MLECLRIPRYSFLNTGFNRKIVFIDSEGTRQDGSLEADIASIVSIVMSSNCFLHCEKTFYGDIPTMNKILVFMKEIGIENTFRNIKFSILIKGGAIPTDIIEDQIEIKKEFNMLPFSSVFFIPPPDSVENALNEKSDFSEAMKKALKESVENNLVPIPYETWKNSLNFTIHGIEMIPFCHKHPDSPIGIKKSLISLSQLLENQIPSKESYTSYFDNVTMCLALYSKTKNKPEGFSKNWEEIENLQLKLYKTQEILEIVNKKIKKYIGNLEHIMQNGLENIKAITVKVNNKLSGGEAAMIMAEAASALIFGPFALLIPALHTAVAVTKTHEEIQQVKEINLDFKQLAEFSLESSFMQIIGITIFYELDVNSILEKSKKCVFCRESPSLKMIENWIQQIVKELDKKFINSIISESPLIMNRASTERISDTQISEEFNQKEWSNILSRLSESIYAHHLSKIGSSLESFIYQGNPFESSVGSAKLNQIKEIISCYRRSIKIIVKNNLNLMAEKLKTLIMNASKLF